MPNFGLDLGSSSLRDCHRVGRTRWVPGRVHRGWGPGRDLPTLQKPTPQFRVPRVSDPFQTYQGGVICVCFTRDPASRIGPLQRVQTQTQPSHSPHVPTISFVRTVSPSLPLSSFLPFTLVIRGSKLSLKQPSRLACHTANPHG